MSIIFIQTGRVVRRDDSRRRVIVDVEVSCLETRSPVDEDADEHDEAKHGEGGDHGQRDHCLLLSVSDGADP